MMGSLYFTAQRLDWVIDNGHYSDVYFRVGKITWAYMGMRRGASMILSS